MTQSCPWGIGAKTMTLMVPETTYGTVPDDAASKAVLLPFNSNGIAVSQNTANSETIRGNRNPEEAIKGNVSVEGDLVIPVDYNCFGYLLAAAFNNPTTVAGTGNYVHTYKITNNQPSFILEKVFPGISQYIRAVGCKVGSLAISVGGDGELTATVSVMGKNETLQSTTIASNPSKPALKRAQNFQAKLKIGGTECAVATSFSLTVDFGLDGDSYAIGTNGLRQAICEGLVTVSGEIEAFFKDNTMLTLAENNTETSAQLTLTDGTNTLDFKMPEIKFARTSPAISGPAGVKQTLSYNAYYNDATEASAVVVTLTNDVESYALWSD